MLAKRAKTKQFLNKSTLKASFSIRNLKRSTIKEFYAKEETKRRNYSGGSGGGTGTSTVTTTNPINTAQSNNQLKATNNIEGINKKKLFVKVFLYYRNHHNTSLSRQSKQSNTYLLE